MFDVGILTWHKSLNHGAILQAYASQKFLESNGYTNVLLNYNRNVNVMESNIDKIKRRISYFNINHLKMKLNVKEWNEVKKDKFENFSKNNLKIGKMYDEYDTIKSVMIGSDMVFDFYEGYNPFMYGKNVNSKNIFSYAACFGYTTEKLFDEFDKKEEIVDLINKMSGVGYRDENTKYILRNKCFIKDLTKNIDPVLLYGFEKEKEEWDNNGWKNEKYILIYSYQSNLNKLNEIKYIKKFAKKENLKIVSVGYYHAWCDVNINADPKEFVELFANSKYVITDTFHGLVFSIIMQKQFALIVRNNSFKVIDLLRDLKISYNVDDDFKKRIDDIKLNKINYDYVNSILLNLRQKSSDYILKQLVKGDK